MAKKEKPKLLYVDDEKENLSSFKFSFMDEFKIFLANSGEEGLNILQKEKIDLILSDQRMPEMTGEEFFEKVSPLYPHTKRMIMTGYSDIEAAIGAVNKGKIYYFFRKPWDENEVRMVLKMAYEMLELERVRVMFGRYLSEEVALKLIGNPNLKLGGDLIEAAILFCDIRDFTQISEKMAPAEVVKFLNCYFGFVAEPIQTNNGVINKFIGDAIMAIFSPIFGVENYVDAAFKAALGMQEKLGDFNQSTGGREIKFGIGLHSGPLIAGNIGTPQRLEYTVIGDTVNTASRIEHATKELDRDILLSQPFFDLLSQALKSSYEFKNIGDVEMRGREDKISLFSL
ncbi:adenylate/guanylate cyclase domain-containing protein [Candidatus Riflebacteria bacterium]